MMNYSVKFWITLAAFQLVFGYAVFAITREYYSPEAEVIRSPTPASTTAQPGSTWPSSITASEIERLASPLMSEPDIQDPIEMSRRANEYFANRQYNQAALLYERLLALTPDDANVYNDLGLTLHYIGRSTEALRTLNEGVAVDPQYQRIWLTLGFVNAQLGNVDQARMALTKATEVGTDESIRQSATKMLADLP